MQLRLLELVHDVHDVLESASLYIRVYSSLHDEIIDSLNLLIFYIFIPSSVTQIYSNGAEPFFRRNVNNTSPFVRYQGCISPRRAVAFRVQQQDGPKSFSEGCDDRASIVLVSNRSS